MGFSIFDILKEAEGDEEATSPEAEAPAETPADNNEGDDFDIDTTLDDAGDDAGEDTPTEDDGGDEDMDVSTDDTGDSSSSEDSNEEVNEDDNDLFSALSAEEQQIKIMELKGQYKNLYSSLGEIAERLNDLETDENTILLIARVSDTIVSLQKYISDYLIHVFPQKSFIENDITFNRFLSIVQNITQVMDKYRVKINKMEENN